MEVIDNINNEEVEEEEEVVNNYGLDLDAIAQSDWGKRHLQIVNGWTTISSIKYTLVRVINVLMYINQREIILIYYILDDFSLFY